MRWDGQRGAIYPHKDCLASYLNQYRGGETMAVMTGQGLLAAGGVYFKPRVLLMLLLGFSAGLPLALSGSTLIVWMADRGVDLGTIGLYSLAGLPYTLKFLWAPAVDALRVPFLSHRFGRRRGWLLFSQLALMAAIIWLGSLDPLASPFLIALGALIVATLSATQDIVIDAFRVEKLEKDEQAAGMAYYVSAYRVAMLVSTAGVLFAVSFLEKAGVAQDYVWFYGYALTALLILIGMGAVLLASEPDLPEDIAPAQAHSAAQTGGFAEPLRRFVRTAYEAFADFLAKPHVWAILAFVVLFKFCDALAGVMTAPFVLDIGFSKQDYAAIVKGVGLAAALVGGFFGGMAARALSMAGGLWLAGLLQMASNLMFVWQSQIGAEHWALVATITVENFSGAVGTVIFIAYLSALCGNSLHTATQFALLTALAAVGRTVLSSGSGYLAQALGWPGFFLVTVAFALPAFVLLAYLQSRGHFAQFRYHEHSRPDDAL